MAGAGHDTPGRGPAPSRAEPEVPAVLQAALAAAPIARERFDALTPAHRREYVRWVSEARRADTRERRAAQTVMRLLERS